MYVEPITSERTDDINALNIATKNVVSYMVGYLLRRITFCPRCQSKMTVASLPENDTSTTLLKAKAYRPTGTLIYPSQAFASLIGQLETVFVSNFPLIVRTEKVLMRLVLYAESCCEGIVQCDSMVCKQNMVSVVQLFMKIRIFHAIKTSNANNACTHGKRNRKMLKLMHM